ncbi:Caspase-6 [Branchiostoma belcheri]|nr:Caspase-6 [Branchiostoma belcheri]
MEGEPVNKRYKGDGDSTSRGAVGGRTDMEPEEQGRAEPSVVGPRGPQHAERVVTDSYQGGDGPDGKIYSISKKRAPPPEDLVQNLSSYEMNHRQRGMCLVFDNKKFHETLNLKQRIGTRKDAKSLKKTFKDLGFSVEILEDKTTTDITEKLVKAAKEDHSQRDCFVCVFLSHGKNGTVYGQNGLLEIKELTDLFRGHNCKSLRGKPKLFIFQACRGAKRERPVEPPESMDRPGIGREDEPMDETDLGAEPGVRPTLPAGADFLMAYSTSEGFYSYRNKDDGSWYIQDLCRALRKHGTTMEIQEILTLVNRMVSCRELEKSKVKKALGTKQMPCVLSMLTKRLFFTPKP